MADHGRELLIARVARHQLVEFEKRQCGYHRAALPPVAGLLPVETFDQQDVLSSGAVEAGGSHIKAGFCCELHRHELCLHDVVEIVLR